MRQEYDIFEKFPNGSTRWRTFVTGRFEAERRVQELRERSENEFFALPIQAETLPSIHVKSFSRHPAKVASAS